MALLWRTGNQPHLTHVFWSCAKLAPYLGNVNTIIEDIIGYAMPKNCAVMYRGNTELAVTKIDRYQANILERPLQDIGIKLSL